MLHVGGGAGRRRGVVPAANFATHVCLSPGTLKKGLGVQFEADYPYYLGMLGRTATKRRVQSAVQEARDLLIAVWGAHVLSRDWQPERFALPHASAIRRMDIDPGRNRLRQVLHAALLRVI